MLDKTECLELLGGARVGRIVYTERALPAIRPVYFALHDNHVVIRTSGIGALTSSAHGAVVAFEADQFSEVPRGAWSVTIIGRAREVTDSEQLGELVELGLEPWTPLMQGSFLTISIEAISGRRIPG